MHPSAFALVVMNIMLLLIIIGFIRRLIGKR